MPPLTPESRTRDFQNASNFLKLCISSPIKLKIIPCYLIGVAMLKYIMTLPASIQSLCVLSYRDRFLLIYPFALEEMYLVKTVICLREFSSIYKQLELNLGLWAVVSSFSLINSVKLTTLSNVSYQTSRLARLIKSKTNKKWLYLVNCSSNQFNK